MDALPIIEANASAPYCSQTPGNMHACGHDAHTAILLGVAHLLKAEFASGALRGNVRFLFQPAEEDTGGEEMSGAPMMIRDGALEGVDAVIALHVDSLQPVGQITLRDGPTSAAVDTFSAWITASGGHGAYPHESGDPLWMLGPVLMALHGIVARKVDPMKPAVVSLGQIHAGAASNVIPAEVFLNGTLRSFDLRVREQLLEEVERALSVVRVFGGDYRLEIERGYPAGFNHAEPTAWLERTATDLIGAGSIDRLRAGMGAEDFAYMTQQAPGAMFHARRGGGRQAARASHAGLRYRRARAADRRGDPGRDGAAVFGGRTVIYRRLPRCSRQPTTSNLLFGRTLSLQQIHGFLKAQLTC